ncbi:MAG: hypothetical protein HY562_03000 [Ignavibacteriales bacterium]|nr:hypothetical protein [Ignavibacteriales bacterium]
MKAESSRRTPPYEHFPRGRVRHIGTYKPNSGSRFRLVRRSPARFSSTDFFTAAKTRIGFTSLSAFILRKQTMDSRL